MKILHKRIIVSGVVQGVGFRYSCLRAANSLGIKGYVKNLSNGNVYIVAAGSNKQLNYFIKWCKEGNTYSKVDSVEIENDEPNEYNSFDISN